MKKVICIGSITKDVFLSTSEARIIENKEDPTAQKLLGVEFGAKLYADSYREALGGSAVNVGAGLLRAGLTPLVFSRVSNSDTGAWLLKQVGKEKLRKRFIQRNGKVESEISIIISDSVHNDHVIFRTGDSVERFDLQKALQKFRWKTDWAYIGSQKDGWQDNLENLIAFAKRKQVRVACNPSGYQISKFPKQILEFFKELEIVFLNRDEAIELLHNSEGGAEEEIGPLFERLAKYGAKILVITDGDNGAYVAKEGEIFYIQTQSVEIVDTVGAGDAFASGFMAGYIKYEDVQKAISWGVMNSASVISIMGGTNGLLKEKELIRAEEDILSKIKKIN